MLSDDLLTGQTASRSGVSTHDRGGPALSSLGSSIGELRALALAVLRHSIAGADDTRVPGEQIRSKVRQLCDAARSREIRAEQLLILTKEAWRELPEARRSNPQHTRAMLDRVITLLIDEYYAPQHRPQG